MQKTGRVACATYGLDADAGRHRAGPTAETLKVWETRQGLEPALARLAHRCLFTPGMANTGVQGTRSRPRFQFVIVGTMVVRASGGGRATPPRR